MKFWKGVAIQTVSVEDGCLIMVGDRLYWCISHDILKNLLRQAERTIFLFKLRIYFCFYRVLFQFFYETDWQKNVYFLRVRSFTATNAIMSWVNYIRLLFMTYLHVYIIAKLYFPSSFFVYCRYIITIYRKSFLKKLSN